MSAICVLLLVSNRSTGRCPLLVEMYQDIDTVSVHGRWLLATALGYVLELYHSIVRNQLSTSYIKNDVPIHRSVRQLVMR